MAPFTFFWIAWCGITYEAQIISQIDFPLWAVCIWAVACWLVIFRLTLAGR